jgi:hypothetical protein
MKRKLCKKLEEKEEDLKLDGDAVDSFDHGNSFIIRHKSWLVSEWCS